MFSHNCYIVHKLVDRLPERTPGFGCTTDALYTDWQVSGASCYNRMRQSWAKCSLPCNARCVNFRSSFIASYVIPVVHVRLLYFYHCLL